MKKVACAALYAAIILVAAACAGDTPADPYDSVAQLPDGMMLSNALAGRVSLDRIGMSPSLTGSATTLAFLSAIPGTLPGAISISVSNKTKPGAPKTAVVVDGGFDPVGIEAVSGDELTLTVSLSTGRTTIMTVVVPPRRPPAIVRTRPAKGRTDVALNTYVLVVFSEPVEASSVTQSSLTLKNGVNPVTGTVKVSDDRLTAEFIPDNALDPQTTYTLALDAGIRDLDGDILGETAPVTFTTGSATAGAVLQVSVSTSGPDQDVDGYTVGAQSASSHQSTRLPATGTHEFSGTEPGSVSVALYGLASNCTLTGTNPRVVKVSIGVTTAVTFSVSCVASGALRVTTTTTGVEPDADYYWMSEKDRSGLEMDVSHSFTSGLDLGLPANGIVTASALAPGNYVVTISDIAPNCDPVVPPVQTITIVAGAETQLHFEVTCVEPMQVAFVRGAGWGDRDSANTDIYVAKSNGTGVTRLTSHSGADINPAWSPDGRKLAFSSGRASSRDSRGNLEIYVMNADGSEPVRLTDHAAADYLPAYSPDGNRIAFVSERDGNAEIYVMNSDGSNLLRLTNDPSLDSGPAWSPDGRRIAFSRDASQLPFSRGGKIYVMNRDGSGLTRLTSDAPPDRQPAWSPDGNTIAFRSESRGTFPSIYLVNSDGSQIRRILGVGYFPSSPDWSPDGNKVAFDDWDCWDVGPCPRGIVIGTPDGLYSGGIRDAAEPAWRPRPLTASSVRNPW